MSILDTFVSESSQSVIFNYTNGGNVYYNFRTGFTLKYYVLLELI